MKEFPEFEINIHEGGTYLKCYGCLEQILTGEPYLSSKMFPWVDDYDLRLVLCCNCTEKLSAKLKDFSRKIRVIKDTLKQTT